MSLIKRWPQAEAEIIAAISAGQVIAYPTEAVYGLGGDAANAAVIDGVLRLKAGRDPGKGMVLVVGDWRQAANWVSGIDEAAWQTMQVASEQRATTFILPAAARVPHKLMHRDGGIAIRQSRHPLVQALCTSLWRPLIATSANLPAQPPLMSAQAVQAVFPEILVVDAPLGGAQRPSRIIDWRSGLVLRD